jgi:sirohydrochlorin ferrochelatase
MEGMDAVLYVGHGSRSETSRQQARQLFAACRERVNIPIQELCFLELAAPSIFAGISQCAARGASKIAVVPLLLLPAKHAKTDIPRELAKGKQAFPRIDLVCGEPFGQHPLLMEMLAAAVKTSAAGKSGCTVLLTGRGSSDEEALLALQRIRGELAERAGVRVDLCHLAVNWPSFREYLRQFPFSRRRLIVLPFLLFAGQLLETMHKTAAELKIPGDRINICDPVAALPQFPAFFSALVDELLNRFSA